ncbi:glycosyltransferase 87 family protein [Arthrobacter sp. TMN-37]
MTRSTPVAGIVRAVAATLAAGLLAAGALAYAGFIGLDFRVYRMGGQSVVDGGGTLYTDTLGSGPGSLLFTYPPFAALIFTPLTLVSAEAGAWVFVGLSMAVALPASLYTARYLGRFPTLGGVLAHPVALPAALMGAGVICALGPWRETMAFAQINILLFALIAGDLLSGPHRCWPTGVLTGVAAGIKLTPLVFGLYFLVRGDWRGLRNMALGFAGTIGLGFLLPPGESLTYWGLLLRDTGRIGGAGYVDNLSVNGAILHFAGPEYPARVPWLAGSVLLTTAAAFIIRGALRRGDRFTGIAATALLMLLISPISWSHHWVWIPVILAVLAGQFLYLPADLVRYRLAAGCLFAATLPVFAASPKTIGRALGAGDLDSQQPTAWLMASSAGVFCGIAVLGFWVLLTRALDRRAADRAASTAPGVPARGRIG